MNTDFLSEFFNYKSVRIAIVIAIGVLSLYFLVQTIAVMTTLGRTGVPATDTITVQGSGQATLPPDVARISFSVQNAAPTVADAQAATTKQTNATIDFVKEQNIAEKDIKTESYTISPQYSYPAPCTSGYCPEYRTPKITGYQVSQTVRVTVRDLTKVGTLLEGIGKLEVQNVYGPDFALDDSTEGYNAARADAIAKAKSQAALLAKQLGVRLGKIVNFNESSGGYAYPMYAMGAGMTDSAKSVPPEIPVGENTYNATVSVTYEIR